MSAEKRAYIFRALENQPSIYLACHLLYDLAVRSQDLLAFAFSSFKPTADGGASVTWIPKKTKNYGVARAGLISKKTLELVKNFQGDRAPTEPLFNMSEGVLLKQLSRALINANLEVSSHDFRHTKITDLVKSGMQLAEVQKYVGHTKITTTLAYVKSKV
jgi:integrase